VALLLALDSRTDGQRAYGCSGLLWAAIGAAGASVRPVLAGRAVTWTGRVGQDGESHPRRILRLGEDRASELARSRSDRVHVVDGEGHAPARWAALAGQDRGHDVLEALGCAHLLHSRAQAG